MSMSKRLQLIVSVREFMMKELRENVGPWDYIRVNVQMQRIESISKRIPQPVTPTSKISSQHKIKF